MASFPEGSEGNQLFPGAKVRIHSVPDDSVKSLYNDQVVVIERYDKIVNRVFVKVDTGESLAFSPANLALARVEEVAAAQPRRASVPGRQDNPRGSGGCVLIPGTIVRIHGLRGKDAAEFNAQEAICERWDSESRLMSIRLRNSGTTRAISCKFIRKVVLKEQEALGPDAHRVLQIFQDYDLDGDGLIDREEFEKMLNSLGMRKAVLAEFLFTIDKSRDAQVCYEEFLEWALSPVKSNKTRMDLYWPEKKTDAETVLVSEEEADDHDGELDMHDVERICKGDLPDGWPSHGLAVMNNMHARFPEYPLEGIVFMMARNDFCGGKVLAQIRATGAQENDAVRAGAIKIAGAFPASYQNQSAKGHLEVFEDCARGWNFKNMRDSKINAVARLESRATFKVLEVRRGSEYGFCFGRIEWAGGSRGVQKRGVNYWVVMGLESHGDLAPDQALRDASGQVTVGGLHASQLHFSDARRL